MPKSTESIARFMGEKMVTITITQLDNDGIPWRTFTRTVKPEGVYMAMESIQRAYNMDHTTVTIS